MANYNCDSLSGGSSAGGIFNLSDAAFIALVVSMGLLCFNVGPLFGSSGTVPASISETWGILLD